jgi:hypothetical protein
MSLKFCVTATQLMRIKHVKTHETIDCCLDQRLAVDPVIGRRQQAAAVTAGDAATSFADGVGQIKMERGAEHNAGVAFNASYRTHAR